jgi:hypothetical protein
MTASFTDADASDTHSGVFSLFDGSSPAFNVIAVVDAATRQMSATYTFNAAGTFNVTAQLSDGHVTVAGGCEDVIVIPNSEPSINECSMVPSGPVLVGTSVTMTASFTDADASDTHSGVFSLFDGSSPAFNVIAVVDAATPRQMSATYTFNVAGAFRVTAQLSDGHVTVARECGDVIVFSNSAPEANHDVYEVNQGENLVVAAAQGVLANDTDAQNDALTATLISVAGLVGSTGMLTFASDGGFTFNGATVPGMYSFTYEANDGQADSSTATAFIIVNGPAPVNLRTAGNYTLLSKSGMTTTGLTSIVGDIATSPIAGTALTGFALIADSTNTFFRSSLVVGKVYSADLAPPTPAVLGAAVLDLGTAFQDALSRAPTTVPERGAGLIGGLTFGAGVHKWSSPVSFASQLTFKGSADDVFIMQIAQTLILGTGATVVLEGGAQAKNIFWAVSGYTQLTVGAQMYGNILCATQVVFQAGSVLVGRALAQTAITMIATTVSKP